MKRRIIVIPGWAYDGADIDAFTRGLQSGFDVQIVPVRDLWRNGSGSFTAGLMRIAGELDGAFSIAAWSLGALVALEAVLRSGLMPDRMILFSATSKFCRDAAYRCGQHERSVSAMEKALHNVPEKVLCDFYKSACAPEKYEGDAARARAVRILDGGVDALSAGLAYLRETDLREYLSELAIPTLLVHGGRDGIIPHEAGSYVAENTGGSARFILYENAGHAIIVSDGDRAAGEVLKFAGKP